MRPTVDLEDDVLQVVEELAQQRGVSIGKVLSDLARQALTQQNFATERNGTPLFPIQSDAKSVILEIVNQLRDELLSSDRSEFTRI
jgi:hypothetical protein